MAIATAFGIHSRMGLRKVLWSSSLGLKYDFSFIAFNYTSAGYSFLQIKILIDGEKILTEKKFVNIKIKKKSVYLYEIVKIFVKRVLN